MNRRPSLADLEAAAAEYRSRCAAGVACSYLAQHERLRSIVCRSTYSESFARRHGCGSISLS